MDKLRNVLSGFPAWMFTILTLLLILWLTLMPDPLGKDMPPMFPGADKIVHALMFGFLTVTALLDRQRKEDWLPLKGRFIYSTALVASLSGALIEVLQMSMGLGRSFEAADMAADTAGAFLCALCWQNIQGRWSLRK